jgi:hypothetical protein
MSFPRKQQIARLMQDEETFGTCLLAICMDEFGTEFFEWEPDTLEREAMGTWGIEIPDFARDRIWALVTILTTDQFYRSLELFIHVTNALNDVDIDMQVYDFPAPAECAWALAETTLVNPPDDPQTPDSERFSHDIKRYIGARLKNEGITTPPRMLQMAEYDEDPEEVVGITHGEDEDFINMHSDRQQQARMEIELYVKDRLGSLLNQFSALPLLHGNTQAVHQLLSRGGKVRAMLSPETSPAAAGVRSIL